MNEKKYRTKSGKEYTDDELYTIYARKHFVINHERYELWKAFQIECGNLSEI